MNMDPSYNGYPDYNPKLPSSSQFLEIPNQYQVNQLSSDFDFLSHQFAIPSETGDPLPPVSVGETGESWYHDGSLLPVHSSDSNTVSNETDSISYDDETVFKFLNQMLMEEEEEDIEPNHIMSYDPLAFHVTERSFNDILGHQYPVTPTTQQSKPPLFVDQTNQQPLYNGGRSASGEKISDSIVNPFLAQNIFTDSDCIQQFQRGLEEANKFLPKVKPIVIDLESSKVSIEGQGHAPTITAKKDRSDMMNSCNKRRGRKNSPNSSRGRKHHEREDADSDQVRRSKQSAIYKEVQEEDDELSELFDKVLLFKHDDTSDTFGESVDVQNEKSESSLENGQRQASNGGGEMARAKKQGKKKKIVDLKKLLILCAQSVSINDFKTSTALLKQIRHHSSPCGDGCERLAHYFANGLEARMVGAGVRPQICYNSIASKQTYLEQLKGNQLSISSSPLKKVLIFFMNMKILEIAENATTLHIIDFGIMCGFQWPILIHKLSKRHGGPPKLRITGIDVPQEGFRPTEWIENTGRRLARYCARFKVPFEFSAIASRHWESIKVEDLKVQRNENLVVNCLCRFKNLVDETVVENCPRDSVLKLIRSLNPDIFVHSIFNGSYNSPFFLTRFQEALHYYSTFFDFFDVTVPDTPERLHFESELFGAEVMNVIACEGADRNERPETYKQWQLRTQRAGLKLLPLDPEITESYSDMCKEKYHTDFTVKQGGDWLLQGWKGRIVHAASCWVPA